jgi:hypothetical protein
MTLDELVWGSVPADLGFSGQLNFAAVELGDDRYLDICRTLGGSYTVFLNQKLRDSDGELRLKQSHILEKHHGLDDLAVQCVINHYVQSYTNITLSGNTPSDTIK